MAAKVTGYKPNLAGGNSYIRPDFCVLEDDPFAVDRMALKDLRVWGMVFGGTVHRAFA